MHTHTLTQNSSLPKSVGSEQSESEYMQTEEFTNVFRDSYAEKTLCLQ